MDLRVPKAPPDLKDHRGCRELGIQLPVDGYYGYMLTRDAGAIGGNMVRRMIMMAEQQLANQR
jgi:hypothetical protein